MGGNDTATELVEKESVQAKSKRPRFFGACALVIVLFRSS